MTAPEPEAQSVQPCEGDYPASVQTLIIGGGACGLIAALRAKEAEQEVLILERDAVPSGSTALSAGLVPAAGTALQRAAGIEDDPAIFAADIQKKANNENDPDLVALLANGAAGVIDWLVDRHDMPFSVVADFDYPGHSRRRMHGLPTRSGRELVDSLRARAEASGIDILCDARATALYMRGAQVGGVGIARPDGTVERIGCGRLILACNGFGGNRDMVRELLPGISNAVWFGHDGNTGDAIRWGREIGAELDHLGAYQGHGNVAHPHGILITWATMTEGGFQVNRAGARFWNETRGYSEAARVVLAQPDGEAISVFDARIAAIARQFADFRDAEAQGAVVVADSFEEIEAQFALPAGALQRAHDGLHAAAQDSFGRPRPARPLSPPYAAVRVTGALFHTQGGLCVDATARVRRAGGGRFDNLFAGGGAACGVSGRSDAGYLSGNGMLAACVLGFIAGQSD